MSQSCCDPTCCSDQTASCCEVQVVDLTQADNAAHAQALGIQSLPVLLTDGQRPACCKS